MPSDNTTFMLVLGAIILLSLFYLFSGPAIPNEGPLQIKNQNGVNVKSNNSSQENQLDENSSESNNVSEDLDSVSESNVSDDTSLEIIRERASGMNGPNYRRKNGNKYKYNSYRSLGDGKTTEQVDSQFKINDITKNYNDRFVPVDESGGENAPIDIPNNKGTERDKYDVNGFLPQEKEKDWFETIETVDVKNSHLINIYRPIGANTIGSSHKEAIYDIRGLDKAVCPKFVVSPWLQSSTEPDRSSKSLCA
jgi:hypothetical protein